MRKTISVLLLGVLFNQGYGQMNDSISEKLTQDLEQIYSQGHINGFSVAIVGLDGTLYTKGFGYSDVRENKKYTKNTIQNIASISKTFIGMALLKAQELGKLNLDDPINKHLPFEVINPYFPNEQITIRQLATHTSSIKDPAKYEKNGYVLKEANNERAKVNGNFRSPDEMMAQSTFLERILSKKGIWYKQNNFLRKAPGELFEYSNIAAALAAVVLENATKEPFNEFTEKHIFKTLGMSGTGWSFNEVDFSRHSRLYANTDTELAFYRLVTYPDGGLITSSIDLGKYLTELIAGYSGNGKILDRESYRELFRPQLADGHYEERSDGAYNDEYNMGVFMGMSAHGQIGHTGGDPGVVTHMFFNSKTARGKILIVNTELDKDGIKEFIDIWKTLEAYEVQL